MVAAEHDRVVIGDRPRTQWTRPFSAVHAVTVRPARIAQASGSDYADSRSSGSYVPAAVDYDGLARHVGRVVGDEKEDGVGDVPRDGDAAQRHLVDVLLIDALGSPAALLRLLAAELLHAVAADDARVQRVDIDVVGADLEGDGASEAAQRRLRGRVGRPVLVAGEAGRTADVHDLAVALLDHPGQDVLGRQEGAAQVHGDHLVEVVSLDLPHWSLDGPRDAGGVDQDVDAAECLARASDQTLDGRLVGDVGGDDDRAAAERLDLTGQPLERRLLSARQRHARALTREREADIVAHPLGGPGHDRDTLGELHHSSPSARSRALNSADRSA